jgi:NarL family two-component system response regulator YdfI
VTDPFREPPALVEALTPREHEVLVLLADGLRNREIATRLGISEHTVKFHLAAIFGKLAASSRTEVVRKALRLGLIDV